MRGNPVWKAEPVLCNLRQVLVLLENPSGSRNVDISQVLRFTRAVLYQYPDVLYLYLPADVLNVEYVMLFLLLPLHHRAGARVRGLTARKVLFSGICCVDKCNKTLS